MPYDMEDIYDHLAEADLFVSIGTSGNVYPAAGFVAEAKRQGAQTMEFNLEPSAVVNLFDDVRIGPATETLPHWVRELVPGSA